MAVITLAEVKNILRITDTFVDNESVALATTAGVRLANKPNITIYNVESSGATTQYTTNDYYTTQDYANYELISRISTGAITTGTTVYVDYGYNQYNSDISYLIPFVQDDIIEYCNNTFADINTRYSSSSITLLAGSPPTITDSESQFILEGFASDMDIAVEGTFRNKGVYHADTVLAGTITLSASDVLLNEHYTDEYGGNIVRISRVVWPQSLKLYAAQMIWENINRSKNKDVKSKSLGPSSITYMDISQGGYSMSILNGLNKFKLARVK